MSRPLLPTCASRDSRTSLVSESRHLILSVWLSPVAATDSRSGSQSLIQAAAVEMLSLTLPRLAEWWRHRSSTYTTCVITPLD